MNAMEEVLFCAMPDEEGVDVESGGFPAKDICFGEGPPPLRTLALAAAAVDGEAAAVFTDRALERKLSCAMPSPLLPFLGTDPPGGAAGVKGGDCLTYVGCSMRARRTELSFELPILTSCITSVLATGLDAAGPTLAPPAPPPPPAVAAAPGMAAVAGGVGLAFGRGGGLVPNPPPAPGAGAATPWGGC